MAAVAERYITGGVIPEPAEYSRSPESEIYGRSLSTIRRLGEFMIGRVKPEIINSPEADQARVEFYTSVEEGFGTDMELGGGLEVRDFDKRQVINHRVMAKDLKTPISSMTSDGLKCALETAKNDQHFLPQLIRSEWDHKNALIVDKMANGETGYNTRIVVSPFPEEAARKSGNAYWRGIGYVPHLRRGFVQLYHATKDGVVSGSLSFDGSDKDRLREIFNRCGIEIPETETTDNWLNYAITATLAEEEAKELAIAIADQAGDPNNKKTTNTVDVTKEYGSLVDNVFNESYVHVCESLVRGYQTAQTRELIFQLANKAQHFNKRYADALYKMRADKDDFTEDDSIVLHELLVYSTIEMMRALHLRKIDVKNRHTPYNNNQLDPLYLQAINSSSFQRILSDFGAAGAMSGRGYSACGLEIAPGGNNLGDNPQNAYGGQDVEPSRKIEEDEFGPLEFKCKNGHWNKRPRNTLISQCRIRSCKNSVSC